MTRLHKSLNSRIDRAVFEYKMLKPGDRVLISVSGGADSMAMLEILRLRIRVYGLGIQLFAVYIDLGFEPDSKNRCEQMRAFFRRNQVTGRIIETNIGPYSQSEENRENPCFLCTRMRRKRMFESANELECNKIALGHHKDDIVETILLNLFFQGEISAMVPKQELFRGVVTIIRPLAYVEEKEILRFAKVAGFPHEKCSCPNSFISKRTKMEKIIKDLEKIILL